MSFEKKRMFYKDPVTGQEKPFHPETDAGVVKVGESTLDVELAALKQPATQSAPGQMSAADKTKLDGLQTYTHPDSGVSAGTYKSVTVDAEGHVTAGTNPMTLAGYGITDAAPKESPVLTGTPTAPTANMETSTQQIATTEFVHNAVNAVLGANNAMVFKGTIGSTNATFTALPTTDYSIGWTYMVAEGGTYAGQQCEIGDLLICIKEFASSANDDDWTVVQTNLIGAVTGPSSAVAQRVAVFADATGKTIKDSGHTIETSVPADAKFTDTVYTHPSSGVSADTYDAVTVDVQGHITAGQKLTAAQKLSTTGITKTAAQVNQAVDRIEVAVLGASDPVPATLANGGLILRGIA